MIETITSLVVILNASALGLGVGSSTLAISSFLVALNDGSIDASERSMLGVIYVVLRVAMVLILLSTIFIVWQRPEIFGNQILYISTLIAVLYLNALCMTKHWIPVKLGPSLQAATWYTLGFITSINMFSLFSIDFTKFALLYIGDIIVALAVVNYLVSRKKKSV